MIKVNDKVKVIGDVFPNVVGKVVNIREDRVDITFTCHYKVKGIEIMSLDETVSLPLANVIKLEEEE